jgi:alpha-tubulin suppressor-like RCC1 family protein
VNLYQLRDDLGGLGRKKAKKWSRVLHSEDHGDGHASWACSYQLNLESLRHNTKSTWQLQIRLRKCLDGVQHTIGVTAGDEVVTWGANQEGQSGQGESYSEERVVKPRFLQRLSGQMVTQLVCGEVHTLCVTATAQARVSISVKLCPLATCVFIARTFSCAPLFYPDHPFVQ